MEPNPLCSALPVFDLCVFLTAPDSPEAARLCAALADCLQRCSALVVVSWGLGGWPRSDPSTILASSCGYCLLRASCCVHTAWCSPLSQPTRDKRHAATATGPPHHHHWQHHAFPPSLAPPPAPLQHPQRDPRVDTSDNDGFLSLMENYFSQPLKDKMGDVRADLAYQVRTCRVQGQPTFA